MPVEKPVKPTLEDEEGPDASLRKLLTSRGVQCYAVLNRSGIPIKAAGMEHTESLQYASLLSELTLATQQFLAHSQQLFSNNNNTNSNSSNNNSNYAAANAFSSSSSASANNASLPSTALTTLTSGTASSNTAPVTSTLSSSWSSELVSLRLKSHQHELIVTPDENYTLIVLHNPNVGTGGAAGGAAAGAVAGEAGGEGGDKKAEAKKPPAEEKESSD